MSLSSLSKLPQRQDHAPTGADRPPVSETSASSLPASLPLPEKGLDLSAPPQQLTPPESDSSSGVPRIPEIDYSKLPYKDRPRWYLPEDSEIRKKAIQILLMREAGCTSEEISKALDLKVESLSQYLYLASRNGWLDFSDPRNRLEYQVLPKAVRNLDKFMDDDDKRVKFKATLATIQGLVFNPAEQASRGAGQTNVLSIRIEGAPIGKIEIEGVGGSPAYLEGENLFKE